MAKTKHHKQNRRIGKDNADKSYDARWSIFKTLSDGQWHRNMELKEETELSSRTLSKHLTRMESFQIIEKKKDLESGEYPHPVFYKATPALTTYIVASLTREEYANDLEAALNETKDPVRVLENIQTYSMIQFVELLKYIQRNKSVTNEEINFLAECFLWADYKKSTSKLIEASRKIIDDLNITQIFENPPTRQTEGHKAVLKVFEKIQ